MSSDDKNNEIKEKEVKVPESSHPAHRGRHYDQVCTFVDPGISTSLLLMLEIYNEFRHICPPCAMRFLSVLEAILDTLDSQCCYGGDGMLLVLQLWQMIKIYLNAASHFNPGLDNIISILTINKVDPGIHTELRYSVDALRNNIGFAVVTENYARLYVGNDPAKIIAGYVYTPRMVVLDGRDLFIPPSDQSQKLVEQTVAGMWVWYARTKSVRGDDADNA